MNNNTFLQIVNSLPNKTANPIGKQVRQEVIEEIKRSTPVFYKYSEYTSNQSGYFYKGLDSHSKVREGIAIEDICWWQRWATLLMFQTIYQELGSFNLDIDKVNDFVSECNASFRSQAFAWYGQVFWQEDLELYNCTDKVEVKNHYIRFLADDGWVRHKNQQLERTQIDIRWEMFHHYLKLWLLGASNDEINRLIEQQQQRGLKISGAAWEHNSYWKYYYEWMQPGSITWQDLADTVFGEIQMGYYELGKYRFYVEDFVSRFGQALDLVKPKKNKVSLNSLLPKKQASKMDAKWLDSSLAMLFLANMASEMTSEINQMKHAPLTKITRVVRAKVNRKILYTLLFQAQQEMTFVPKESLDVVNIDGLQEYFQQIVGSSLMSNSCLTTVLGGLVNPQEIEMIIIQGWQNRIKSRMTNNNDVYVKLTLLEASLNNAEFLDVEILLRQQIVTRRVRLDTKDVKQGERLSDLLKGQTFTMIQNDFTQARHMCFEVNGQVMTGQNQVVAFGREVMLPLALAKQPKNITLPLHNQDGSCLGQIVFCIDLDSDPKSDQLNESVQQQYAEYLGRVCSRALLNKL